ncbi:MFS general substrate transporter [Favolaschia claudopus]|uniref:MFS general substrate transporter n=1 Tax=Favolaschia claudopus TaxID=2862362 RepID=A0AAW0AA78_9AGAR
MAASTNTGLIVGLIVAAVLVTILLLFIIMAVLQRRRRAGRNSSADGTQFSPEKMMLSKHQRNDSESIGLLRQAAPAAAPSPPPTGAKVLPTLPKAAGAYYNPYEVAGQEDYDLVPRTQYAPLTHPRPSPSPHNLHVAIPLPPAPSSRSYEPKAGRIPSPISAASSDSESLYSERSAVSARPRAPIDLASPPPPVPTLPPYLRNAKQEGRSTLTTSVPVINRMDTISLNSPSEPGPSSSPPFRPQNLRPLSELPPEEPPLSRGDTVAVAHLLKTRARRAGAAKQPTRTQTQVSRIERAGSIREVFSPLTPEDHQEDGEEELDERSTRPMPRPSQTLLDRSFAETLDYYTSQPISPRSPDDAASFASSETIRPRQMNSKLKGLP